MAKVRRPTALLKRNHTPIDIFFFATYVANYIDAPSVFLLGTEAERLVGNFVFYTPPVLMPTLPRLPDPIPGAVPTLSIIVIVAIRQGAAGEYLEHKVCLMIVVGINGNLDEICF